jgi:3-hydroxybutyryl-CoA dehydrogenase
MINPHGAQGFYDYAHVDVPAYLHQRLGEFGRLLDSSGLFPAFNAAVKG